MKQMPYIALGFVSIVLQSVVLRELLAVFSGNELDIGITLGFWLLIVGLGSLAGSRLSRDWAFGVSYLFVACLALLTLIAIGHIRSFAGLELGETVPLWTTLLSTALVLFPLCFAVGLQFPSALLRAKEDFPNRKTTVPVVYGLESLGAFIGGAVFAFVLAGRLGHAEAALLISVIAVAVGAFSLQRQWVFAIIAIPIAFYVYLKFMGTPSNTAGELVDRSHSRFGEVLHTRWLGQDNVFLSGRLEYSYPNIEAEELSAHLTASLHPAPASALFIGGSPGIIREMSKYSTLKRADMVMLDPELRDLAMQLMGEEESVAVEDGRARLLADDGRRMLKSMSRAEYDLIVVNLGGPETGAMNRFYTREFFEEAKRSLNPGGVLVVRVQASKGYMGRSAKLVNSAVMAALSATFAHTGATTEEYGLFFASNEPLERSPAFLEQRFRQRNIKTRSFKGYIFDDAFDTERVERNMKRLAESGVVNTDSRPVAYYFSLLVWAEQQKAIWLGKALSHGLPLASLIAGMVMAVAGVLIRLRAGAAQFSAFTTGFWAMGMVVVIMLAFQSAMGYVYEQFAFLSGLYMAGIAIGTAARRVVPGADWRGLVVLEALAACFAFAGIFVIQFGNALYAMSLLGGMITGAAFAWASELKSESGLVRGGVLYAYDLAGSFTGAVLAAVLLVPLFGMAGALGILAGMKLVSAFVIGMSGRGA